MDNVQIIGLFGLIVTLIAIVTPLIKLNSSITRLTVKIESLVEQLSESKEDRKEIHVQLDNHECRIIKLEERR